MYLNKYAKRFCIFPHEVREVACWFDYWSTDPDCSPWIAILRGLRRLHDARPPFQGHTWNVPCVLFLLRWPVIFHCSNEPQNDHNLQRVQKPDICLMFRAIVFQYWLQSHNSLTLSYVQQVAIEGGSLVVGKGEPYKLPTDLTVRWHLMLDSLPLPRHHLGLRLTNCVLGEFSTHWVSCRSRCCVMIMS